MTPILPRLHQQAFLLDRDGRDFFFSRPSLSAFFPIASRRCLVRRTSLRENGYFLMLFFPLRPFLSFTFSSSACAGHFFRPLNLVPFFLGGGTRPQAYSSYLASLPSARAGSQSQSFLFHAADQKTPFGDRPLPFFLFPLDLEFFPPLMPETTFSSSLQIGDRCLSPSNVIPSFLPRRPFFFSGLNFSLPEVM